MVVALTPLEKAVTQALLEEVKVLTPLVESCADCFSSLTTEEQRSSSLITRDTVLLAVMWYRTSSLVTEATLLAAMW